QSQIPEIRFQSMQQVRGEIMLLSKSRQLDFIDNYSIFYGLELHQYAGDLLHPNQLGHTLIAANIVGAMEGA
ncbi:hypothetical protein, partial [Klebsiella pneumoniae]|uniref:hypothetical protein n=1 Tax=Klebsiella pneumoniae TaxID=573 RepID=UPI002730F848